MKQLPLIVLIATSTNYAQASFLEREQSPLEIKLSGPKTELSNEKLLELYSTVGIEGLSSMEAFLLGYRIKTNEIKSDVNYIDLFMHSSKKGENNASFHIAMEHLHGGQVEQDLELAAQWMLKSATTSNLLEPNGEPSAQYNLGLMYMKGDGVEQSDSEALKWFRLANTNKALFEIATLYIDKPELNVHDESILDLLTPYASMTDGSKANAIAKFNAAIYLFEKGEFDKSLEYLKQSEAQNYIPAIELLSSMYEEGVVVNRNVAKAITLYEKGYNLGSTESALELSRIYLTEPNGKSIKLALLWKHRAIESLLIQKVQDEVVTITPAIIENYYNQSVELVKNTISQQSSLDKKTTQIQLTQAIAWITLSHHGVNVYQAESKALLDSNITKKIQQVNKDLSDKFYLSPMYFSALEVAYRCVNEYSTNACQSIEI